MDRITLLDCTLRDGGYINDWRFGKEAIVDIIDKLEDAKVDILELGFMKNEPYLEDRTVFNSMAQVKRIIGKKQKGIQYAVMAEVVNPMPLEKIDSADDEGPDIFRVIVWKTKHNEKGEVVDALQEGYEYCKGIVEKGYKLCVQPARVDQYSDEEFVAMIQLFQQLDPYAIYVVDSWGTRNPEELLHYMHLADDNMKPGIALGYHGHNNMMQALSGAQMMLAENFNRNVMIDASVYGIGRGAGNLNSEIIAKYLNERYGKAYVTEPMVQIYDKYIKQIYEVEQWGYSVPYYLTAKYNCNPNYVRHFQKIGIYDNGEIEQILSQLDEKSRIMFSASKVDELRCRIKKKLAIVVPIYKRYDEVQYWVDTVAKDLDRIGGELIFYSSDTEEDRRILEDYIHLRNAKNVYVLYYDKEVKGVLCRKVYAAAEAVMNEYDYIWIVRDRSIPSISVLEKHLKKVIEEEMDYLIFYPHYIDSAAYGTRVFEDASELLLLLCGEMTSLGSILFSQKALRGIVREFPVDEKTNEGLWLPIVLFQYIAEHPFRAYYVQDAIFHYLPYTNSFWLKNGTLLWLFEERWNTMVDMLPSCYDKVRERVRSFYGWSLPPFCRSMILNSRSANDLYLTKILKHMKGLKRCASDRIPALLFFSMIPTPLIRYYMTHKHSLVSKLVYSFYQKIAIPVFWFFKGIALQIKSVFIKSRYKEYDGYDYGAEHDSLLLSEEVKSTLLYGEKTKEVPFLSIVIPTNKRFPVIKDAIRSVLNQLPVKYDWELLVVDNEEYDGYSNETQRYIEALDNHRICYYRNEKNLGAAGNMNRCVTLARGKWVSILHDDDCLTTDFLQRIEKIIRVTEKNAGSDKKVGLIFAESYHVSGSALSENAVNEHCYDSYDYYNYGIITNPERFLVEEVLAQDVLFTGDSGFKAPSCGCTFLKEAYIQSNGMLDDGCIIADLMLEYKVLENYRAYRCVVPFGFYRWGDNESAGKIENIMCSIYNLREYNCRRLPWGNLLYPILRFEYAYYDWAAFAALNKEVADQAFYELVDYKEVPLRRFFAKALRKLYRIRVKHNRLDCNKK